MRLALQFVLLASFPATTLGQGAGITDLGTLSGGTYSLPFAVSGDGRVVVGFASDGASGFPNRAFRWTQPGGMVSLGILSGGYESSATGVNSDGSVVVGVSADGIGPGFHQRAFRWTQATGMVDLGFLNGGFNSTANGVNGDGSVVVGEANDGAAGGNLRAFRWTQAGGMLSLGTLNGGLESRALGVSGDGSVVVGATADGGAGGAFRAFRWTQVGGMLGLGTLNGGSSSLASGANSDGSVVVGTAADGAAADNLRAFRWTPAGGMTSLGILNGGTYSFGRKVNSDGSVIVGVATDGAAGNIQRGFRWTQATGMQTVETWLRSHGVSVPIDITGSAEGVNSDGSVVVGQLQNAHAFIARVSVLGGGLVTLHELQSSLSGNTGTGPQAASLGGTVMHGAHSRPLAHRVEMGKSCFWTAGDVGRNDHGDRDGSFGLAEVGGCHRLAQSVQGSLSLGRSWSKQGLVFNGKSSVRATYGVAELLGNIPGTNLWPSAALLYQEGDAEARRGYFNAGAQDFSSGRPDVRTTALRLRVDWDGAVKFGGAALTPYADASYARTRIDAYTETGGGFPARFEARRETATEWRLGADAAYPLTSTVTLLGRLEAAHRFEKTGASTAGTVLGVFSFDLPGQQIKRDWLRGGVGVEAKLGGGTVSAMLNATTQGAVPSYWLNASYQVTF